MWDSREAKWEVAFVALAEFAQANGHARVQADYSPGGIRLQRWTVKQRQAYREGRLPEARVLRLEAVPGWSWDPYGSDWEEGFGSLLGYVGSHGDAFVPQGYTTGDGFALGGWVSAQRSAFRSGAMSPERAERLQAVSGWVWDAAEAEWDRMLALLIRYAGREGHTRVPMSYQEDGERLGRWVHYQRRLFRDGQQSTDRVERLERVSDWSWSLDRARGSDRAIAALSQFVADHGHARVPDRFTTADGFRLGNWCQKQRARRRDGTLDPVLEQRLDALGMVWSVHEVAFNAGLEAVRRFQTRHGRLPHQGEVDERGARVGQWLTVRRQGMRDGTLTEHEVAALLELGVEAAPRRALWERGFRHLQDYVVERGHVQVPSQYSTPPPSSFRLGTWLNRQRREYAKGTLPRDRLERLEGLGVVWDVPSADWEVGFQHVATYLKREGNAAVPVNFVDPVDGYRTGSWVNLQRDNWRNQAGLVVQGDRSKRLEGLPGWVWVARHDLRR